MSSLTILYLITYIQKTLSMTFISSYLCIGQFFRQLNIWKVECFVYTSQPKTGLSANA